MPYSVDAVVVGAGPNGLTAAVTLAEAGLSVEVFEAAEEVGGGARTEELTLPGFRHDPCSAVHPTGIGSPAFRRMPLAEHGLEWVHHDVPLAHPLPDGSAAVLARSVGETAMSMGPEDAGAYRRLVAPFTGRWDDLAADVLRPPLTGLPRHPALLARLGVLGVQPATLLARRFSGDRARGLFAGLAAHAITGLGTPLTSGVGLMFALAGHDVGWPIARGGSQAISDALAGHLRSLGGKIHTGRHIRSLTELPSARAYLFNTAPEGLLEIAGERLPARKAKALGGYRHGLAVFKIDYAMDGPVPWTAPEARRAGTVHVGGTLEEIDTALVRASRGLSPEAPFLITAQPTLADPTRAPEGKHVFYAYGHVPFGWTGDATDAMERQLERFAPGFRDLVLARHVTTPADIEAHNPNNIGGDIGVGSMAALHSLLRPALSPVPYTTGAPDIFLCSSATPPGPGVHGLCGHYAARTALRKAFGRKVPLSV
ncbi:phytoene desaturase family protein [Wenjunlia tyrosinilytica]|uniref:Dehydrogenase n=1 Tax=Wenjunlia tyrosinilytica TaxID=1544741 RepID=A0A917ZUU6_9ACTN|nr:NAD(P)/FAD-dependent oxidoreductase [Wenjunlia tyrosinilytica]GGO95106.1 dehydrogenase [Wenjunlia tyrosinilytica]